MKKFTMRDQTQRGGPNSANANFEFNGESLIDAIKSNFPKILDASTYYSKPFRFPMTVTVTPPDKSVIHTGKPGVRVDLEWLWAERLNQPATKQTHFLYLTAADESDIPLARETFVVEK